MEWISSSPKARGLSNDKRLEIYSLYKIRTVSLRPKPGTRPGLLDWTGSAKWDAWDKAGISYEIKSIEEVEKRYLEIAEDIGFRYIPEGQPDPESDVSTEGDEEDDIDLENLSDDDGIPSSSFEKGKASAEGGAMSRSMSTMIQLEDFSAADEPDSIHSYALGGNIEKLAALLDGESVDIDAKDEYGYTPLHLACDRGQFEVVKLLLSKGSSVTIQDADGNTSLVIAKIASHENIVKLLEGALHR